MVTGATSISSQAVNNTTVNGSAILEPWKEGHQIVFVMNIGALPGATSMTYTIQGRLRSDGATWQTLKDASANNLALAGAKFDAGGASENSTLLATLRCDAVDSGTYEAVRIIAANSAAAAAIVGISHIIWDVYSRPTSQTDEIFAVQIGL